MSSSSAGNVPASSFLSGGDALAATSAAPRTAWEALLAASTEARDYYQDDVPTNPSIVGVMDYPAVHEAVYNPGRRGGRPWTLGSEVGTSRVVKVNQRTEAFLTQLAGKCVAPCDKCSRGHGMWNGCLIHPAKVGTEVYGLACANCLVNGQISHYKWTINPAAQAAEPPHPAPLVLVSSRPAPAEQPASPSPPPPPSPPRDEDEDEMPLVIWDEEEEDGGVVDASGPDGDEDDEPPGRDAGSGVDANKARVAARRARAKARLQPASSILSEEDFGSNPEPLDRRDLFGREDTSLTSFLGYNPELGRPLSPRKLEGPSMGCYKRKAKSAVEPAKKKRVYGKRGKFELPWNLRRNELPRDDDDDEDEPVGE